MEFNPPKSIYQQIADHVRARIIAGEWLPGERIPSVREMAVKMGVNPNTVARSYQSLLDNETIENCRGIGYFVTPTAPERILDKLKGQFVGEELPRMFETMQQLGISLEDLILHYKSYNKEEEK